MAVNNAEHEHRWFMIGCATNWQVCIEGHCERARKLLPGVGWVEYAPVLPSKELPGA